MLKPGKPEITKTTLKQIYEVSDEGVTEDGFLTVDDCKTKIEATSFLYNLLHPKKGLHDPDYKRFLENIHFSPSLVANFDALKTLQPTRSKTLVGPEVKTLGKASKKQRLDEKPVAEESQTEEIPTGAWETPRF